MEMSPLVRAVNNLVEEQIKQIELNTRIEVDRILNKANEKAAEIREQVRAEGIIREKQAELSQIGHIEFNKSTYLENKKRDILELVLEKCKQELYDIRGSSRYYQALPCLINEAVNNLSNSLKSGERILLFADPRDEEAISALRISSWDLIKIQFTINCWGGVIVQNEDQSIILNNTLEKRFENALPFLQREVWVLIKEKLLG
jgi:vacuolar-type H+-ATPase subunit E/Vma4